MQLFFVFILQKSDITNSKSLIIWSLILFIFKNKKMKLDNFHIIVLCTKKMRDKNERVRFQMRDETVVRSSLRGRRTRYNIIERARTPLLPWFIGLFTLGSQNNSP